jgi:hypothetical protein
MATQSWRRAAVRFALYAIVLVSVGVLTASYWTPVLLHTDSPKRTSSLYAAAAVEDPSVSSSLDLAWNFVPALRGNPDIGNEASVLLTTAYDPVRAAGRAVNYYVGVSDGKDGGPGIVSCFSYEEYRSVEVRTNRIGELSQRLKLLFADALNDVPASVFEISLESKPLVLAKKTPSSPESVRVTCGVPRADFWSRDAPDYYLSMPAAAIVAPWEEKDSSLRSANYCAGADFERRVGQNISSTTPAITSQRGNVSKWRSCGDQVGGSSEFENDGYYADPPLAGGDPTDRRGIQRIESLPVDAVVRDLEDEKSQGKILFLAGVVAGLIGAIGVEILNVAVEAASEALGAEKRRRARGAKLLWLRIFRRDSRQR